MAKKHERVPGTTEAKPNREQRRHPEGGPEDQPLARDEQAPETPDVPDQRDKKTAENWNQ
jgi:hypothetical protein